MELKQIKELMTAMSRTGIKEVFLKKEEFELLIKKEEFARPVDPSLLDLSDESFKSSLKRREEIALSHGSEKMPKDLGSPVLQEVSKGEDKSLFVTSPMVGTLYLFPSPEDPPFIKVGDRVEKSTVVCIVEAMKVMNEIRANVSGIVTEVLVENGQPVEFGSKIFRLRQDI